MLYQLGVGLELGVRVILRLFRINPNSLSSGRQKKYVTFPQGKQVATENTRCQTGILLYLEE